MVCRMYFRLSMACACSSAGSVRGVTIAFVTIALDDTAAAARFQVLFDIKKQARAGDRHSAQAWGAFFRGREERSRGSYSQRPDRSEEHTSELQSLRHL